MTEHTAATSDDGSEQAPALVFVHGAGRSGAAAWPEVTRGDARFLDLSASTSLDEHVRIVRAGIQRGDIVVAHSLGAVAAVLALRDIRGARAIVLIEPALFDLARGDAAIEGHIDLMDRADREFRADGAAGFWRIVRPVFFGGPFDEDRWAVEAQVAERFATLYRPWGHGITATDVLTAPTTVVTGGWNREYEAVAEALAAAGATICTFPGTGHRPQDDPRFGELVDELVAHWDAPVTQAQAHAQAMERAQTHGQREDAADE